MIPISARVDTSAGRKTLADLSVSIDRYLIPALDRAAIEVTREAKEAAPKAFSNMANAIHWERPSDYLRIVATGSNYASYVETGIKPNQPKMPNVSGLATWVNQKHPGLAPKELSRLTYAIGKSIQVKGIKAKPFMEPTAAKMADRVTELIQKAVFRAIDEIGAKGYA